MRVIWAGGRTTPPLDKPKCGWENELCVEQEKKGETDEIAINREGNWAEQAFAKTSGAVTGDGQKNVQ